MYLVSNKHLTSHNSSSEIQISFLTAPWEIDAFWCTSHTILWLNYGTKKENILRVEKKDHMKDFFGQMMERGVKVQAQSLQTSDANRWNKFGECGISAVILRFIL